MNFSNDTMKKCLTYILALIALGGCVREEAERFLPNCDSMMTFGVPNVEHTRSTLITNANQLQDGTSMGVYGMYEVGNEPIFTPNKTNYPQEVTKSGSIWTYTPLAPWKQLMNHKFRAFYPYDPYGNGLSAVPDANIQQAMCNADRLVLDYYTQVNKFDLMVAYTTRHPYNESQAGKNGTRAVEMPFKHALSALRFKIKHGAAGGSDKLMGAYLKGISASGVLLYQSVDGNISRGDWTLSPIYAENLYTWSSTGKNFTNTVTATAFGDNNEEVIFAIPQQNQVGNVQFVFRTGDSSDTEVELPGNVDTDSDHVMDYVTWEPGKLYEYTVVVKGASLDVTVTIKEWNDYKSNVDVYIGND